MERQLDPALAAAPLVVGGRPWDQGAVLDACPQAEAAGVCPGMRLTQAERLCPDARFVPAHEERYRAAHDALVATASRCTPAVESAGLGLLYAEVSGLQRRFGSEPRLAQQLAREAEDVSGLSVQVGIANGKFVAEQAACAARPGSGCTVPPGDECAFLSPLHLSVLPADPEMLRRLHLLGVRTLGVFAALPRLALVRQFGPHAGPLHDLARGADRRPVHPVAPPPALERRRTFNDPLDDRARLLAHAAQMAGELAETLARHGDQAEGLQLRLEDEAGAVHAASRADCSLRRGVAPARKRSGGQCAGTGGARAFPASPCLPIGDGERAPAEERDLRRESDFDFCANLHYTHRR